MDAFFYLKASSPAERAEVRGYHEGFGRAYPQAAVPLLQLDLGVGDAPFTHAE